MVQISPARKTSQLFTIHDLLFATCKFALDPFTKGKDRVRRRLFFEVGGFPVDTPGLLIEHQLSKIAGLYRWRITCYDEVFRSVELAQTGELRKIPNLAHIRRSDELGPAPVEVDRNIGGRTGFAFAPIDYRRVTENEIEK